MWQEVLTEESGTCEEPAMNSGETHFNRSGHAGDQGRGEAWLIGQLALLLAIALAPRRVRGLPAWPAQLRRTSAIAGLLCGAAGAALALAGARSLGPNLTIYPRPREDGALVQEGIYSVMRHPIYTGLVLGALGWSLLRASTLALALTGALALFFDQKARREEAWLASRFPAFQEYRQRVRRWGP
jgi:protein-S-isoprenylcysteine O-methyltransferase Ste14